MPFLILLLLAAATGIVAGLLAWQVTRRVTTGPPTLEVAEKIGEEMSLHPRLRAALDRGLKPESTTELALAIGLLLTVGAGVVLGLLAYLVRTNSGLIGFDNGVAKWGNRHASPLSTHALTAVTQLGNIDVVVVFCLVLAIVETRRERSRWIAIFIVAVMGGEEILANVIKLLVDRTRPSFNAAAASLGPSFPSGHSTTAAAFYATAALLLGRHRSRATRAALTGAAVGIAVAVACSRVLLDFHWLTDVIGGLMLGWGWFALCGIAFGGRIVYFGAAAELAAHTAAPSRPPPGRGAPATPVAGRPRRRV
jgi:undecaprenyl-diphosphatase